MTAWIQIQWFKIQVSYLPSADCLYLYEQFLHVSEIWSRKKFSTSECWICHLFPYLKKQKNKTEVNPDKGTFHLWINNTHSAKKINRNCVLDGSINNYTQTFSYCIEYLIRIHILTDNWYNQFLCLHADYCSSKLCFWNIIHPCKERKNEATH